MKLNLNSEKKYYVKNLLVFLGNISKDVLHEIHKTHKNIKDYKIPENKIFSGFISVCTICKLLCIIDKPFRS
jgi:hypothetical protein